MASAEFSQVNSNPAKDSSIAKNGNPPPSPFSFAATWKEKMDRGFLNLSQPGVRFNENFNRRIGLGLGDKGLGRLGEGVGMG